MKKLLLGLFCFSLLSCSALGQQKLLSYEDISYLLHNKITKADTFMLAKGYAQQNTKPGNKIKKYLLKINSDTQSEVTLRPDGRKLYISLETNVLEQYNLLLNSISQYKTTASSLSPDVTEYDIKDLGKIFITISDAVPYNPIKKDYNIEIIPDKNIAAID